MLEKLKKAIKKQISIPFELTTNLQDPKEIMISFKKEELKYFTFEKLKTILLKIADNHNLKPAIFWDLPHCVIYCLVPAK